MQTHEIKEGQKWRNRAGKVATILGPINPETRQGRQAIGYCWRINTEGQYQEVTGDGKYWASGEESDYDLVSLVAEPNEPLKELVFTEAEIRKAFVGSQFNLEKTLFKLTDNSAEYKEYLRLKKIYE